MTETTMEEQATDPIEDEETVQDENTVKVERDPRTTDEIDPVHSRTWRVQLGPGAQRRRRSILPLVTLITAVVAGLAITLALLMLRSPQPTATRSSSNNEDPLALYQVATELYAQGEYNAALQMIDRARKVTQHARALRLLDSLQEEIQATRAGQTDEADLAGHSPPSEHAMRALINKDDEANVGQRDAGLRHKTAPWRSTAGSPRAPVYVESEAVGDVFVDGDPSGARTPAKLDLPPGRHVIEVVPLLDPTERLKQSVTVRAGRVTSVTLTVPSVPSPSSPTPTPTGAAAGRHTSTDRGKPSKKRRRPHNSVRPNDPASGKSGETAPAPSPSGPKGND